MNPESSATSLATTGDPSPLALAARISGLGTPPNVAANRSALAAAVQRFHDEIGVFPETLGRSLKRIRAGGTIVRLAHQPNFLPYDNLLLQLRYLHHLEHELSALGHDAVALMLLVDHDIAANKRFRSCDYFDPGLEGLIGRICYPAAAPHALIAEQPVPPSDYFVARSAQIASLSHRLLARSQQPATSQEILDELAPQPKKRLTTTHVTAFAWMRAAYHHELAPNLVFAPLSALEQHLRPVYVQLSARIGPDARGFERYWTLCSHCHGREEVRRVESDFVTKCTHCQRIRYRDDPAQDTTARIVPRVLLDILTDYAGLDVSGGTAYKSRSEPISPSHALARAVGISTGQEAIWRTDILHTGVAGRAARLVLPQQPLSARLQRVLTTGRMGMAHYLAAPHELAHLRLAFDAAFDGSDRAPTSIDVVSDRSLSTWLRAV